jgi:carboxypeptidase family protein
MLPSDDTLGPDRVLFRVRVIESFRGTEKAGEVVRVRTGFGGGDCGYSFKIGAKYLIDASKNDDVFLTGICSLTAPIDDSEVELRTLRRIAAGQRPPDLVGVLMRGTETDDGETFTPLPRVPVEARSITGGSAQKTVTDAFGSFTFERLPEGKHELILGLPTNLSAAYTDSGILSDDQVPSISIESKDADGAACHVRIVIEPSASISGVVQSKRGAPIEGWVNADTVTPDDKPWNTVRSAIPGPDGRFSLGHLKPGRYSVQFTSRAGFVRGKLQIIELGDGERRTGVILLSQ